MHIEHVMNSPLKHIFSSDVFSKTHRELDSRTFKNNTINRCRYVTRSAWKIEGINELILYSSDKYEFKRHGKLEYLADVDRSSDFKYRYVSDRDTSFSETLHTGALHNINAEVGLDIVFSNNYSIFVIYERNQAIDYGHTDNLYIALGYLPYDSSGDWFYQVVEIVGCSIGSNGC